MVTAAGQKISMGKKVDFWVAVLNGVVGDHLARTENDLATAMGFFCQGVATDLRAIRDPKPKVAVLVHGLMCTEAIWAMPDGEDYGSLLARDLGVTPLYVRYNSGLAIPDSGAHLDALLEKLVAEYPRPIDELTLIGYSMGGLVIRNATGTAKAQSAWLPKVKHAVYVGTPHRGAPLERVGRVLASIPDPYTRLIAQIAALRAQGIKDLGDGDPVPLLPSITHALIAGSIGKEEWTSMLFGDGMVPVASASHHPALLPERVRVAHGLSHMAIAHHVDVYAHIKALLS